MLYAVPSSFGATFSHEMVSGDRTNPTKIRSALQRLHHPNFGLPSIVLAGVPRKRSPQTGFGALTYTTSSPTALLGVALGGDWSPRIIAFQVQVEFQDFADHDTGTLRRSSQPAELPFSCQQRKNRGLTQHPRTPCQTAGRALKPDGTTAQLPRD